MMKKTYNPKSAVSILNHAMVLLGKSLRSMYPDAVLLGGKGGLGKSVEKFHYGYEPNSDVNPDFAEAGLELKCTPLKVLKDKSMAAKERLVLNIINYNDEAQTTFDTSSFWHKNQFLLLMFYLHELGINPIDMIFKMIRTWTFPKDDLKIIRDDWNTIHSKILQGQAHKLTEGDTLYLAACMKGSRTKVELREQPYSDELAQQRAYSLKQGYVNKIIMQSFLDEEIQHHLRLTPKRVEKLKKKYSSDKVVKSIRSFKQHETFEQLIERRLKPFYGKTVAQIEKRTHVFNLQSKNLAYNVCRAILDVKTRKIQEFENAGILLKSIVLEADCVKIKESMSFPYIRFVDIVNQEWEESDWYKQISSKFLFTVFRKSLDGDKSKMKFIKVFFWNMPYDDLLVAKKLWDDTKQKVSQGNYDNFITKTHEMCHVRPHGTKNQTVVTPQGGRVRPKSFWLNNDYILNIVVNNLDDASNLR